MTRVLIIGGYGNFGRYISKSLAQLDNIQLIIAGRNKQKAKELADSLSAEAIKLDIHDGLFTTLKQSNVDIVVHTSGPFQSQNYLVAEACIEAGAHYIDLADAREFVSGIMSLQQKARQAGVLLISGASSVPCLTSALIEHYKKEFSVLETLDYGITTAQKTTRGLATTAAILSYTGKPFTTLINGDEKDVYGWQNLHVKKYQGLGYRLLGNCNVPDLSLFPELYPQLKTIRFYAGLELPFIHLTLWGLSWLVRARLIESLSPLAPLLLKLSFLFDFLGSANSGFHMQLHGQDQHGKGKSINVEIIARNGDGPFIPCMPAILLVKKLADGDLTEKGAKACVGLITKEEYLSALDGLDITFSSH